MTNVTLCAEGADGKSLRGEYVIGHQQLAKKPKIWLEPEAKVNTKAIEAILQADVVVVAPGNLYGSLAPALVVPGIGEALRSTTASCVYVANLVTKPGPTDGYKVHDFADEVERLAGGSFLDYVICNTEKPDKELLAKYAHEGEYGVEIDNDEIAKRPWKAKGANIIARDAWLGAQASDPLASTRSYIRHDSDSIARQLMRIYFA